MLIKSELEQMLHSLEMERKKCNDELAGLPAGTLISSVRNKQPVYFNALGTKETYRRISINSDEETKRGLARKKYLQLRLMRIEEDIAALRNANQRISGMTNDENYIRHHRWKMNIYEKMDIVPWKNLIVTYDDEYGNVSIPLIESEIKYKLMKF